MNLRQPLLQIAKRAHTLLPEALLSAGAAAVTYGVALINVPAGWIIGGALLALAGYVIEKGRT